MYVRTDVHDVMAIKPNFLTSMGYHIFLSMVLRARAPSARAELRYYINATDNNERPPFDCPGLTMLFYNTVQHLHIKFTV